MPTSADDAAGWAAQAVADHLVPAVRPAVPLCALQQGSVRYGARLANDGISVEIRPGEVVALLGENGAGKSTALHAMYGLVPLSEGRVCYDGQPVVPSPERAIAGGVGLVSQHFLLVQRLTVAENIVLGREPRRLGLFIDAARAEAEVVALGRSYGLEVHPRRRVSDLSVGEAQRVEILKALYRGARCLLLDEPTAVLTPPEAISLLRALRRRFVGDSRGRGLLIVTHKLDEVLEVADRAIILRGGRMVTEVARAAFSAREMAHALVGRTLVPVTRQVATHGAPAAAQAPAARAMLSVRGLSVRHDGVDRLRDVSFDLRPGEILGIGGVEGNGQSELCQALAGLLVPTAGQVELAGVDIASQSVDKRRRAGMAWVLEDRHRHGLVLDFSLTENLLLGEGRRYRRSGLLRGVIARRRLGDDAQRLLRAHDVRPADPELSARALSGGNQQKLLLARALSGATVGARSAASTGTPPMDDGQGAPPKVLIVAQPTRGVDIGAVQAIHQTLLSARDRGCAILLVSSELDELRVLSDRIAVLYRGRVVADLENPADAPVPRERLGELLAGVGPLLG